MSPIHRPGFEPAAAPEFTLSPFVIPTPSRDETRIRNLQTQVPGRLAASTGDLNRGANTAVCRCVCKSRFPALSTTTTTTTTTTTITITPTTPQLTSGYPQRFQPFQCLIVWNQ